MNRFFIKFAGLASILLLVSCEINYPEDLEYVNSETEAEADSKDEENSSAAEQSSAEEPVVEEPVVEQSAEPSSDDKPASEEKTAADTPDESEDSKTEQDTGKTEIENPAVEEPSEAEPAVEEIPEEKAEDGPEKEPVVVEEPDVEVPAVEEPAAEAPDESEGSEAEPETGKTEIDNPAVEEPDVEKPVVEESTRFEKTEENSAGETYSFCSNEKTLSGTAGTTYWTICGEDSVSGFSDYSVEVLKSSGSASAGYGIIFCQSEDEKNGYCLLAVLININRCYCIGKMTDSRFEKLRDWTFTKNLHAGYTSNLITVKKSGEKYQVYFNGNLTAEYYDKSPVLKSGNRGLVAVISDSENFPEEQVKIRYEIKK